MLLEAMPEAPSSLHVLPGKVGGAYLVGSAPSKLRGLSRLGHITRHTEIYQVTVPVGHSQSCSAPGICTEGDEVPERAKRKRSQSAKSVPVKLPWPHSLSWPSSSISPTKKSSWRCLKTTRIYGIYKTNIIVTWLQFKVGSWHP